jgi:hypothetical protein
MAFCFGFYASFEYKPPIPDTNAICIIHIRPIQSPVGIREGTTMRVSRPNSQVLVVTKRRQSHIGFLALCFVFYAFWYYILLDLGKIPDGVHPFDHVLDRLSAQPFLWLFVLAPVLSVLQIFNSLRIAVVGEEFTFNGLTRTVLKNQKQLARFNEIAYLQIRTIRGESTEHRLTAVLQTSDKFEIHTSSKASDILELADDVADILGVRVVRKE